uniref:Formin-like 2b n=1 Tax=Oncorhynchus kisutch TaxID=8019 RepID=A0A8C7KSH4_ONCKI
LSLSLSLSFSNSMNLPPDKVRLLRCYDNEKKWELICDQERFQVKNPPHTYIQKLRGFLDPAKFRRRVQESTQVLRELEISLRTNHIGWVREFLNEENQGLDVLVEYLSFAQYAVTFDGEVSEASTEERAVDSPWSRSIEDLHGDSNLPSPSSVNTHTTLRSNTLPSRKTLKNSRLVCKKDDVHVCVMCLRAIMNYQYGFNMVMSHPHAVNEIALSLNNRNPRTKALVLELLAAVCLVRGGHEIILSAFDNFKTVCSETLRFEKLMEHFKNEDDNIDFMVACMQFINIVVHSVEDMNFRVHLQYDFTKLNLDDYLERLKHTESDRLQVQIQAYLDNVFDVGTLLEDAETKTAALERVEELEENMTHVRTHTHSRTDSDTHTHRQTDSDTHTHSWTDPDTHTHSRTDSDTHTHSRTDSDTHTHTVGPTLIHTHTVGTTLIHTHTVGPTLTHTHTVGPTLKHTHTCQTGPTLLLLLLLLPHPPPPPPLCSMESSGPLPPPPPPCAPPLPGCGGSPTVIFNSGLAGKAVCVFVCLTVKIKKPIQTKFRMPVFNWVALKPSQINGTVFNDIDDERILQELNVEEFEEMFKTKAQGPAVDVTLSRHKAPQKGPNRVSLLEANRAKNLAITLRKAGQGPELICRAIQTFDMRTVRVDFVECLMRFLPTEGEVKMLRQYERDRKPVDTLSDEDRFMLQFSRIERLAQRMSIITFMGNFQDNIQMLTPQLHAIIAASVSIKSSQKLKKILEIILALGNYMNSSKRGAVYGFKLQSLDLLLETKTTDRKQTLLHYIANVVREKYPGVALFYNELHYVEKAAAVSLENVVCDVKECQRGMDLSWREYSMHGHNPLLKDFISKHETRLQKLQEDAHIAQDAFDDAVKHFGESSKTMPPSVFFPVFVRFIKAYRVSRMCVFVQFIKAYRVSRMCVFVRFIKAYRQESLITELRRRQGGKDSRHVYEGKDGAIEDIITGTPTHTHTHCSLVLCFDWLFFVCSAEDRPFHCQDGQTQLSLLL